MTAGGTLDVVTEAGYDAAREAAQGDGFTPDPRRWRILAVTLVIGFMALLDVTIVNVALPSIRAGLGASTAGVQWVVSGYALTFGLTLVAGGRLGDALGRRRMMLIGLTGFMVSSAAVGLAPNEAWVVVARLLQGASAGLLRRVSHFNNCGAQVQPAISRKPERCVRRNATKRSATTPAPFGSTNS